MCALECERVIRSIILLPPHKYRLFHVAFHLLCFFISLFLCLSLLCSNFSTTHFRFGLGTVKARIAHFWFTCIITTYSERICADGNALNCVTFAEQGAMPTTITEEKESENVPWHYATCLLFTLRSDLTERLISNENNKLKGRKR